MVYDWAKATEETAKAVQKSTDVAKSLGAYVSEMARGTAETAFGIVEDRLRYVRGAQAVSLYKKALKRLEDAGLDNAQLRPPPPSIEIPLLAAATNENREDLVKLWEQLLAAAIAPTSREKVRLRHIEILKQLEPLDARILDNFVALSLEANKMLEKIETNGMLMLRSKYENFCACVMKRFDAGADEVEVSLHSLMSLGLIHVQLSGDLPTVTALGRNFLFVVTSVK